MKHGDEAASAFADWIKDPNNLSATFLKVAKVIGSIVPNDEVEDIFYATIAHLLTKTHFAKEGQDRDRMFSTLVVLSAKNRAISSERLHYKTKRLEDQDENGRSRFVLVKESGTISPFSACALAELIEELEQLPPLYLDIIERLSDGMSASMIRDELDISYNLYGMVIRNIRRRLAAYR